MVYKRKYKRLKRAALLLSVLCCLGGAYVTFDVWKHNQHASEQTQKSAIFSNEINQKFTDREDGDANGILNNNDRHKKEERKEKLVTDEDIAS